MKKVTVKFEMEINVPDWVEYITIDENGDMFGFGDKPRCHRCIGEWVPNHHRDNVEQLEPSVINWTTLINKV